MIKHSGGCHCGRVRFEIMAPEDILVSQCNCSICSKSGYLGLLVARSRFKLLQGEDCFTTYTFNTGVAQHLFCRYCGVKSFYVPRSHPHGYNVNARCLDPGTIDNMTVRPFNGQEWEKHSSAFLPLDED
jgi:hypothetical protein